MKNNEIRTALKSIQFIEKFLGTVMIICMFLLWGCVGGLEQGTMSNTLFCVIVIPSGITAILAAKSMEFVYELKMELRKQARLEREKARERERATRRSHINFNYDLTKMNRTSPTADKVVLMPRSSRKAS